MFVINEDANRAKFPRDRIRSDNDTQRIQDRVEEKLNEPEQPRENDERAKDGKASQQKGDEKSYPESSASMWFKNMEGLQMCIQDHTRQMGEVFLEPRSFTAVVATIDTTWHYLRHGLEMEEFKEEQKKIDEMIDGLYAINFQISDAYARNKIVTIGELKDGIKAVRDCWEKISYYRDKLGLSIRFRKTPRWEKVLEMRLGGKKRFRGTLITSDEQAITKPEVKNGN